MNNTLELIIKKTTLYKILKSYYENRKRKEFEASCRLLQEKGLDTLVAFDNVMRANKYDYTLAFGTLLGAIREKNFIEHDDDIDVIMWYDDYTPSLLNKLEEAGFKLIHSFSIDNDRLGKEDTFVFNGIQIDIFYLYNIKEFDYPCCSWYIDQPGCKSREESISKYGGLAVRRIETPISRDIIYVPFKNIELPVPANYENVLRARYGDNYMTPIPGFKTPSEMVHEWEGVIGSYKVYK